MTSARKSEAPPEDAASVNEADAEYRASIARALLEEIRDQHPRLMEALRGDVEVYGKILAEPRTFDSDWAMIRQALRLAWMTDSFAGLFLYRVQSRFEARRVPVVPRLLKKVCSAVFDISIGEWAVLEPGIYLPHGYVVIDGNIRIKSGTTIAPWVSIGLREGGVIGPRLGNNVFVGTGAKILGDVQVGSGARIGTNSAVVRSVPPHTTVSGIPARMVADRRPRKR